MAVKHRFLLLALLLAAAATFALWPARDASLRPPAANQTTPLAPPAGTAPAAAPAFAAGERRTAVAGRPAESPQAPGLRGRTVDDAGRPLAGVQVFAFPVAAHDPFELTTLLARGVVEPPAARTTSDGDGSFLLALAGDPRGDLPVDRPPDRPPDLTGGRLEIRAIDDLHADAQCAVPNPRSGCLDVGDLVLGNGYEVRGSVVDDATEGRLAGATVRLLPQAQLAATTRTPGREDGRIAITDGEGLFRFPHVAAGVYTLRAEAPGHAAAELQQQPVAAGDENVFDFALPRGGSLRGTVHDAAGHGIAGALVRAEALAAPQQPRVAARSGTDGRFELPGLADDTYRLTAAALSFQQTVLEPVRAPAADIDLELAAQGALRVHVADAAGTTLDDYRVRVRRGDDPGAGPTFAAVRAALATPPRLHDGAFVLTGLDPGEYRVEIAAPGFALALSPPVAVAAGDPPADAVVVVRAGGAVRGTVVDDRGRPLPSADVELRPAVTEGGATMALFQPLLTFGLDAGSAVTRPDGTFAFAHVAPATYLLRIRHGDFAPRTRRGLVVAEGESLDLGSLPLARGTRLSGSVTLDGAPLEGARVQVLVVAADELPRGHCGEARSDAGGGWQLAQRLPPGRYLVLAGRVVPDNPFQESADEALTRAEVEITGEAERSVAIAITSPPPAQRK